MTENNQEGLYQSGNAEMRSLDREVEKEKIRNVGTQPVYSVDIHDVQDTVDFAKRLRDYGSPNTVGVTKSNPEHGLNKKISEKLGYRPRKLEEKVFDVLQKYGLYDRYKNSIDKAVTELKTQYLTSVQDFKEVKEQLEGKFEYEPFKNGSREEFQRKKSVPETSKGLYYKMEEERDLGRLANDRIDESTQKMSIYDTKVKQIETDLADYKAKLITPEVAARIKSLSQEKDRYQMIKSKIDRTITDLTTEFIQHGNLFIVYQGKVNEQELAREIAESNLSSIRCDIETLDAYIRVNQSEGKPLRLKIGGVRNLREKSEKFGSVIEIYQSDTNEKIEEMKTIGAANGPRVLNGNYFSSVAEEKEMHRVKNEQIRSALASQMGLN